MAPQIGQLQTFTAAAQCVDGRWAIAKPWKGVFLRLSSEAVADVNVHRDVDGLSYARKSMIICGMALNTNGKWEESQLRPELQQIINKYRHFFEHPDES